MQSSIDYSSVPSKRAKLENKMAPRRIVIALGGNAIKQAHEKGTCEEQFKNVETAARSIVKVIEGLGADDRVLITHGNGPQSGNLSLQIDMAKEKIPIQPLDVIGAMTQGQIGYMLQITLKNLLKEKKLNIPVVSVVNHVLVDEKDPEFEGENASKPVGNFLTEEEAMTMKKEKGWIVKKVKPTADKPWRRVVPSPNPIGNLEADAINTLVDSGAVVIASGGGGIPVVEKNGVYVGIEAVIDKDLAGERLGAAVKANTFLVVTDVDHACINYGKPDQKELKALSVEEAEKLAPHFAAGSMGPKVRACTRFVQNGIGERAIITSLSKAYDAIQGTFGTQISK